MLLSLSLFLAFGTLLPVAHASTYAGVRALYSNDSGYEVERLAFNRRFDLYPHAITFPGTADEVAAVVKQGTKDKLQVVARGGAHSYIASGLGGKNGALVVDMRNFTNITVDSSTSNAEIGSGSRLGDVATILNNYGRGLPHGTCPYVGIGGHASFGGFGFQSRMWGLTLDNVISATVVLANGTITTASATQNTDLFWAVRGAAPSFGIVVSRTFKTYAVPEHAYTYDFEWELTATEAANALLTYQNFTANTDLPPYYGGELTIEKGISSGKVHFILIGQWFTDPSTLNATLKPFLGTLPEPTNYYLHGGTYIEAIADIGGGSLNTTAPDKNDTFYAKSLMTPQAAPMNYKAAYSIMNTLATTGYSTDLNWFIQFELYGGNNSAISAVPVDSTSFARRNSQFTIQFYASSANFAPPYPAKGFTFLDTAVSDIVNSMPKNWDYGMYTNYVEDKVANWQKLYYGNHYARLESIKKSVDPKNTFHFLTSIEEPSY